MGFYAKHVFPRVMDWMLRGPQHQAERETVLRSIRGDVLEVGFGTGLNLRHYPPGVTRLTAIDVATMLPLESSRPLTPMTSPTFSPARLAGWMSMLKEVPALIVTL